MAEEDGVLSREVAIAAKLEENGVALRAKSRAVAAIDRLVGSLFDLPAAFFEGVSGKKRLRDETYRRLKDSQARIAEQQIECTPGLGLLLIGDVLGDRARKQVNAAGVVIEAIEALKALPPPPKASPDSGIVEAPQDNIDEDWMNQFVRFAEDASSERLQQAWGRVLAGEIRKPGSFSRHTLRFVSELDKETAENCELVSRHVVGSWLLKGDKWNEGHKLLVIVDLQRLGIIGQGLEHQSTLDANGIASIAGNSLGIVVRGTPGTKFSFPIFMLTRMGQEVMSLLDAPDDVQNLSEIAARLDKSGLESISLGQVSDMPNDQILFEALQPIWQDTSQQQAS